MKYKYTYFNVDKLTKKFYPCCVQLNQERRRSVGSFDLLKFCKIKEFYSLLNKDLLYQLESSKKTDGYYIIPLDILMVKFKTFCLMIYQQPESGELHILDRKIFEIQKILSQWYGIFDYVTNYALNKRAEMSYYESRRDQILAIWAKRQTRLIIDTENEVNKILQKAKKYKATHVGIII